MNPLARLAVAALLLAPQAARADATLAPIGVLRAVYLAGNPVQAVRDPANTGAEIEPAP